MKAYSSYKNLSILIRLYSTRIEPKRYACVYVHILHIYLYALNAKRINSQGNVLSTISFLYESLSIFSITINSSAWPSKHQINVLYVFLNFIGQRSILNTA